MRHRVKDRKLKRPTKSRLLLLRNLTSALIINGKILTTKAKAKEVQKYTERLITVAKKYDPQNTSSAESINSARYVFSFLQNKTATKKLLNEIAPKYKNLNGGYTRILKYSARAGDSAPTAIISFVEQK